MNTQIITLSSGRGPAECCWVVAQVLKQLLIEARNAGHEYTIIDEQKGDQPGTYQSVSLSFSGSQIDEWLSNWNGTIQWVGTSMYRKYHKRKNWFIAAAVRDDIQAAEINMNQLKFETMRSGGKGGQHVNKVNTAVRVTHLPSGISAKCSDQRSQLQNKKNAIQKLRLKLIQERNKVAGEQASMDWLDKIQVERGNPIKVFSSTSFKPMKKKRKKNYGTKRQQLKQQLRTEQNE
jgi:peptide chain release factor